MRRRRLQAALWAPLFLLLVLSACGEPPAGWRGGGGYEPLAQGGSTINYTVRAGDTLSGIADRYGVSVSALMSLNGLRNANAIRIGQTLRIPVSGGGSAPRPAAVIPGREGPDERIIPDSEGVYSPAYMGFDVAALARRYGGYLSTFSELVEGERLTGPQIVQIVSERFSVGPRVLLAALEMRSGWLTGVPTTARQRDYPLDIDDKSHKGLYWQLWRAANAFNAGYYGKSLGRMAAMQLEDGSYARFAGIINPGSAGVQNLLGRSADYSTWLTDIARFRATYQRLFGDPFDNAIEPLVPATLKQPLMRIPFEDGRVWYFTGGPHGGWADGSAWGAIDFAPNGPGGCAVSAEWVVAVTAGRVAQAERGRVMLNLEGSTFQGKGWTVMYMHLFNRQRVALGDYVFMGDRIGHPSCEGGYSQATHLHIARLYNGQWLSVSGDLPFELGGWVFKGTSVEYDGTMSRASINKPAINGHVDRLNAVRGEMGPAILSLINSNP